MADNLPAAKASGQTASGAAGSHAEPAARDRVIAKRTRNTRTRSGAVLSADLIADTAMTLVSEHGAAELSVRRLGAALGCDPTAVYRYFASMDALMLAVADRLIGQALASYQPGPDWKENLRSLAHCTYQAYLAHPKVAIAVASRVTGGENETRIIDLVLGQLRAAGFQGEHAVRLYRSFGDFILAFTRRRRRLPLPAGAAAGGGHAALAGRLRRRRRGPVSEPRRARADGGGARGDELLRVLPHPAPGHLRTPGPELTGQPR